MIAKVLVVEDDEDLRDLVVSELEDMGHRVATASNGEDGLITGADYYITKPIDFQALEGWIKNLT